MEEFFQWYHLLLETIGASDDPSLAIDLRSYENKLSQNDFVLWNWGHRFRYYPIIQYDYGNLLEALALDQYENIEFSSLKLFRDNSELMEEYDIRDEYELHNLLKKILSTASESKIHFKKMPIIVIGTPNRDQQVIDLLMQCAPITNVELAKKYEELYGVRWNTSPVSISSSTMASTESTSRPCRKTSINGLHSSSQRTSTHYRKSSIFIFGNFQTVI